MKLQNCGISKVSLKIIARNLRQLDRNADLNDPESVVAYILRKDVKPSYKNKLLADYKKYLIFYEIDYPIKFLKVPESHIRIPTTKEVDGLILSAHYPTNIKLRLLKETGITPIAIIAGVAIASLIGLYYYRKIKKPKHNIKKLD